MNRFEFNVCNVDFQTLTLDEGPEGDEAYLVGVSRLMSDWDTTEDDEAFCEL